MRVSFPRTTSVHVAIPPGPTAEEDQAHQSEEQEHEKDEPEDTTEREETEMRAETVVGISIAISGNGHPLSAFGGIRERFSHGRRLSNSLGYACVVSHHASADHQTNQ